MAEHIRLEALADARGWTHQKVRRLLSKRGVKIVRGKCDADEARAALEAKTDTATADEKRFLECKLLSLEIDKACGELVPIDEHKGKLLEMQNVCNRIVEVWIETISAKRRDPTLAADLRAARDAVYSEVAAILNE